MNLTKMTILSKKNRKAAVLLLAAPLLVVVTFDGNIFAQTYINSAHGNSATGIERSTLGVTVGGAAGFAIGNCVHCHEQHASVGGAEPVPDNTGPDVYLGFDLEEELCYGCHGAGNYEPATRQVRDLIETDTAKLYGHGPTMDLVAAQYRHRAKETSVDGISTSAHVECTDCHNPHLARTENDGTVGPRAKGSNVIGGNSPLLSVSGIEYTTYPTGWTTSLTTWNAANPANYTFLNDIPSGEGFSTKEYQICFKCHSSFSGNTDDWDGNPADAGEWTDLALEFNPANNSYHPVVAAVSTNLDALQLIGVDRTWAPGETMYCSDCHGSNDASTTDRYGPHGSTTKWLLTGTYQNWPFTDQTSGPDLDLSGNGQTAPPGGFVWANLSSTTDAETFCRNCHADPTDAGAGGGRSNNVHASVAQHGTAALECAFCHIRVPHGGAVSRLISTNTAGLPNRYRPSGAVGGSNPYINAFIQQAFTSYNTSDCEVPSGGPHGAIVGGESW